MKNYILLLLSICIVISSCEKEREPLIIIDKTEIAVSDAGGSFSLPFESNMNWTAKSDESWCTITPAFGEASVQGTTIIVSANDTYDARSCTVTFTVSSMSRTMTVSIKVNQSKLDAIILSSTTQVLSFNSQTIEVELKTNVNFEVIIPESAKDWVSYTSTKALRAERLFLKIAANQENDNRTTEIYVKNKISNLQDTLTITQHKEPYVYWVKNMGSLETSLKQIQKDTITKMIVKGEINRADFLVFRKQMPKLKYLDLKDVKCEDDKIPDQAFINDNGINIGITTIVFPESIKEVGNYAFRDYFRLTGPLNLPAGLTKIGKYAFEGCTGLTGPLNLPSGLTTIGNSAFHNCTGFNGPLSFPNGLTEIGEGAFLGCTGFTGALTFPAGLKAIGGAAFGRCPGFTGSLTLPAGLTIIESGVFFDCSGLSGTLTLPAGLTNIGEGAFWNCNSLIGPLNLPAGLTTIGERAFYNCNGLTGPLNLPSGLTTIEKLVFSYCTGFTGPIRFPDGLAEIGEGAFLGCKGFTGALTFPTGLKKIGGSAFGICSGFTGPLNLPAGLTIIERYVFFECFGLSGTLTLPAGLTTIREHAFYNCSGLTGLSLGINTSIIDEYAFGYCSKIAGNVFFPASLVYLGTYAFEGCNAVSAFRFSQTSPLPYSPNMFPNSATVEVPTAAVSKYKSTYGWKDYNIVGY
jgi:hypothetical protein